MLSQVLIKNDKGNYEQACSSVPKNIFDKAIYPFPENKGQGNVTSFSIAQGLALGICRCRLNQDYMALFKFEKPMFSLGFSLKGHSWFRNRLHPKSLTVEPGQSYAHFFEDRVYERKIKAQQEVLSLAMLVSPGYLLKLLDPEQHQDAQGRALIEKIVSDRHYYTGHGMTARMKTTFFQILNNTHQGRIGRIYLESKALELIALKLDQIYQPTCFPAKSISITPGLKEQIYHARDLLVKNLQFPPSLRDLAKQARISHSRLTNGFKTVFGCTVFEYLRKERLSYARMLIEKKTVDLTWVAYESGFCSSSHFAASFHKEYGIRPSEYRKSLTNPKTRDAASNFR